MTDHNHSWFSCQECFQKAIDHALRLLWKMSREYYFQCPHCGREFHNPMDAESHFTKFNLDPKVRGVYFQ
jgi:hypothetical protein